MTIAAKLASKTTRTVLAWITFMVLCTLFALEVFGALGPDTEPAIPIDPATPVTPVTLPPDPSTTSVPPSLSSPVTTVPPPTTSAPAAAPDDQIDTSSPCWTACATAAEACAAQVAPGDSAAQQACGDEAVACVDGCPPTDVDTTDTTDVDTTDVGAHKCKWYCPICGIGIGHSCYTTDVAAELDKLDEGDWAGLGETLNRLAADPASEVEAVQACLTWPFCEAQHGYCKHSCGDSHGSLCDTTGCCSPQEDNNCLLTHLDVARASQQIGKSRVLAVLAQNQITRIRHATTGQILDVEALSTCHGCNTQFCAKTLGWPMCCLCSGDDPSLAATDDTDTYTACGDGSPLALTPQ